LISAFKEIVKMKRKIILSILVLCILVALFSTTVMGMGPQPHIDSLSLESNEAVVGAETTLRVDSVEPAGADWQNEQFQIRDPGTTYATMTPNGVFLATAPGTAIVTVEVYDVGRMASFKQDVQITVRDPVIINTQSLPNGQVGVPYVADLEATGPPRIYWDPVTDLPPGLLLVDSGATATIEGTPTASGTYQINVEAANNYTTAHAYFTIQIAEADPQTEPTNTVPATGDSGGHYT
jgi:hypothetical protein